MSFREQPVNFRSSSGNVLIHVTQGCSPYRTHHCVRIRHLIGNIADCSFIYSTLISFLLPKVPLRSTLHNGCNVKGAISAESCRHSAIDAPDKRGFGELTEESPSEGLCLVSFILEFLPPRCTLSFSSFLIITLLGRGSGGAGHIPG